MQIISSQQQMQTFKFVFFFIYNSMNNIRFQYGVAYLDSLYRYFNYVNHLMKLPQTTIMSYRKQIRRMRFGF